MACADLLTEVARDGFSGFPSRDLEWETMDGVMRAVFDASADVAGLAMKCASAVARSGTRATASEAAETLCARAGGRDAEGRDAACVCLKTMMVDIGTFGEEARSGMLETCVPALASHVETAAREGASADETNAAAEAVDVIHSMATAMNAAHIGLNEEHRELLQRALFKHLEHGKSGTRKRAAQCAALLAARMDGDALSRTMKTVMGLLEEKISSEGKSSLYSFILGATARACGYRFRDCAGDSLALLLRACESSSEEYDEDTIDNIESALQAMELIITSCQSGVQDAEKTAPRVDLALKFLSYDPNFDDDEPEEMDTCDGDDDEEDEYSDDEDYDDDDDESWKVRRAAAKVLSSIVSTASEATLTEYYDAVTSKLLSRTKDREPSVQLDIFSVLGDIVRVSGRFLENDPDSNMGAKLRASTSEIVRVIARESTSKSAKTQVAAFTLLSSLAAVFPGILSEIDDEQSRSELMTAIERCIGDKAYGNAARIEALTFVSSVCKSKDLGVMDTFVPTLLPVIFIASADKYYKLATAALHSCASVVALLKREGSASAEHASLIKSLLDAVLAKLAAADEDHDVKEAAIHACAVILAHLNHHVNNQDQSRALGLLLERSRNETNRLSAVRAYSMIASSSSPMDLSAVATSMMHEFTTFLRKSNKSLRESSLTCLSALISLHRSALQDPDVVPVVTEASALLNEEDLHLATLAIRLLTTIIESAKDFPNAVKESATTTVPLALKLARSPLVQRQTLKSLQDLYKNLVLSNVVSFKALFDALSDTKDIQSVDSQFVAHSLAKCVAAACLAAGSDTTEETTRALLTKLPQVTGIEAVYALLCIGEIGRLTNLSANTELEKILLSTFDSEIEDVKGAAALALGRVAVGNRDKYLPLIISALDGDAVEHQYSLLQALREIIVVGDLSDEETKRVLAILYGTASSTEEGVRNVVAECLGRLAASDPSRFVQDIHRKLSQSTSPLEKATLVSAVKFTVIASERGALTKIRGELRLPEFMSAMSDEDVNVRTAVIKTLNEIVHRENTLIKPVLADMLPTLLAQTAIVAELVRVIDLGAFKHTVDDGLECRKSAFECVNTVLDSCGALVRANDVMTALISGLGDHYDVKMLAHAALRKLSDGVAPNSVDAVLANLVSICEPLEKTLTARMKRDAVQQEIDRNDDMLRSALRAVSSINGHAASKSVASWKAFNDDVILARENLVEMYEAL